METIQQKDNMQHEINDTLRNKDPRTLQSGQQTRRSMISRDEQPVTINQPNIDDILALQLSETLINAAYYLAVSSITVNLNKFCNPLQKMFIVVKCSAYQKIRIYSNRSQILPLNPQKNIQKNEFSSQKSSQVTQINLLEDSKFTNSPINRSFFLTKQQRIQKVQNLVRSKLNKIINMLSFKMIKTKYQAILKIQTYDKSIFSNHKDEKISIQQTFERYQQSTLKGRKFHRRSIEKQPLRQSFNQSSFSLNKNSQAVNRLASPKNNPQTKNIMYAFSNMGNKLNSDKKTSTCSQTQSNNSHNEVTQAKSPSKQYYALGRQTNNPLDRLKSSVARYSNDSNRMEESKVTSNLTNGSFFAEGTKQRQLEILRNKYYRLVEQFKDFSQRFLQVIKEE